MKMNETTEKLNSLAAALGGKFERRENECSGATSGAVVLDSGVRFWVNVGGYANEGRIRVSCNYPQHETRDGYKHTTIQRDFDHEARYGSAAVHQPITANFDKPVAKLAAEIERRYLTKYRTLYAQAVEWCEKQRTYHANQRALSALANDAVKELKPRSIGFYASVLHASDTTVDIGVYGLTGDQVLALTKFLKGL
jgi:hypothetical protein